MANARAHATTKWVPAERFAEVEQRQLQPLPTRPYRSLVVPAIAAGPVPDASLRGAPLPRVSVERRDLSA